MGNKRTITMYPPPHGVQEDSQVEVLPDSVDGMKKKGWTTKAVEVSKTADRVAKFTTKKQKTDSKKEVSSG